MPLAHITNAEMQRVLPVSIAISESQNEVHLAVGGKQGFSIFKIPAAKRQEAASYTLTGRDQDGRET